MSGQGKRARTDEGADLGKEDGGDALLAEASMRRVLHGAAADIEKRLQDAMGKLAKDLEERMDNKLAALEARLRARFATLRAESVGQAPPCLPPDRLPKRIILLRHGESEGNIDHTFYQRCPDSKVELTDQGSRQATAAGERIKKLIGEEALDIFVSPFQRTLQTSRNAITAFVEGQVQRVTIDPRIREQEFGNLQGDDFQKFRAEQKKVGRFWYRFPTGESGADVYDRTSAWWQQEIWSQHPRQGRGDIDNVLVVTHGLTMRLILMQCFGWSPDTFHTVWNVSNCGVYVLKLDDSCPGGPAYRLDTEEGDVPESTKELTVSFKDSREPKTVVLRDYLSIPQPRTEQREFVLRMLEEQHGIAMHDVVAVDFFPESKKFR